ncbi:hypothetical protein ACFOGJ_13460 [Marinibaculum pumilum]|uniref:CYTH domain-containing protein n=1 Tax=Marinibaculum pumilum TaxID=1766165 RepID=A0ABV7L0Y5_9PROT
MSPPNPKSSGPATTPGSSGSAEHGTARTGRGGRAGAYEYRCWPSAGRAAGLRLRLARGWKRRTEAPRSDIYLLPPPGSGPIVSLAKLRDGEVLEIKLWRGSVGRLQYWQPGMRAEFPLPARARDALDRALGTALGLTTRSARGRSSPTGESAAALCAALEGGPARLVTVTKQRQMFSRAGSRVEISRIAVPGRRCWSVAVDDPDARRATAVLARLRLDRLANLNYGQALSALRPPAAASEDMP